MVEHITPNDKMTVRFGHSLFYTLVILRITMNLLNLTLHITRSHGVMEAQ